MRFPRPLLERRSHSRLTDGTSLIRLRLWLAMLGLALVPMLGVVLLGSVVPADEQPADDPRLALATATAAAELMARERDIETRLLGGAADPMVGKLLDGVGGQSERQTADRLMASLRGPDGDVVRGICLTGLDDRVTRLGAAAMPTTSACGSTGLATRALALEPGGVAREIATGPGGESRLLLATELAPTARRGPGVLAIEVGLPEIFESTPSTATGASAALLVDSQTSLIVASVGRDAVESGAATDATRPLGNLRIRVDGILAGHPGTARDLEAAGWVATAAPLWRSSDGAHLGLVQIWPAPVAGSPMALGVAILAFAIAVLVVAVVVARYFLRPFDSLAESQKQLEVLYREAREDSLHDGLTGLGNHRSFQEELDRQLDLFRRHQVPVALLLIDLDDLKVVNDGEGHAAGDQLLLGMANSVRDTLRYGDRAFRTGGDEFAIILPHTDAPSALIAANRLRHFCLRPAPGERAIPFSGGISSVPMLAADRGALYRQADAALYRCKRQNRGTVSIFDPDRDQVLEDPAGEGSAIAIRDVIRTRSLTPVYQPIVDLRTGAVLGFEGLIRPGPATPFTNPGQLFAAAAGSGRTVELDLACFEVVAAGAREIDSQRVVSINLSPRTLEVPDFSPSWLLETLARHWISPGRVIVELTERDDISDLDRLRRNVALLQHAGIRLAADDVGAGNAGLRLLSQVRFDIVKIDLSLVQDGAQRDSSRAVLRSLLDLAGRQGAVAIAEGVETPEQLRMLRELQISTGQGYLLGRPGHNTGLSGVDLAALLAGAVVLEHAPSARGTASVRESSEGGVSQTAA
jgi:diguanylate cyclase (GGDEF)-like protein